MAKKRHSGMKKPANNPATRKLRGNKLRKAFFGKRKTGTIAVIEVSCSQSEKCEQAKRNAEYLRHIFNYYAGYDPDIYRGISYFADADTDTVMEDMKKHNIDFAIRHTTVPFHTMGLMRQNDPETYQALRVSLVEDGYLPKGKPLNDVDAVKIILGKNGYGKSNSRGELAQIVSKNVLEKAVRESHATCYRFDDIAIPRAFIELDGENIALTDKAQIDIVATFPTSNSLEKALKAMASVEQVEYIRRNRNGTFYINK